MLEVQERIHASEPRAGSLGEGILALVASNAALIQAGAELPAERPFHIRSASTDGARAKAGALVRKRYEWRGYGTEKIATTAPNALVLSAEDPIDSSSIGTLTIRVDGPLGLSCDEAYPDIVGRLRQTGGRLAEIGGLAVDEGLSRRVLCSLFHVALIFATQAHGVERLVIEVNPRHAAAYMRLLGFKRLADPRTCERVGAPGVLLGIECKFIEDCIREHTAPGRERRSIPKLYSYAFPPEEAEGIAARLLAMG